MGEKKKKTCPEFPFFGANYPDATCIDGYLWDLDSCDVPGGPLASGGDAPCPFCNAEEVIEAVADVVADDTCDEDGNSDEDAAWKTAVDRVNRFRAKYGFPPVEQEGGVMPVQCKMRCSSVERGSSSDSTEYKFHPVYEGSEENKKFFQWTPYGGLTIGAMKPGLFEVGKEYYLVLTPANPPAAI